MVGYDVVVFRCGVDVSRGVVGAGMPRAFKEDDGMGAECRCVAVTACDGDGSVLIGYAEVADAADTARARTACVSRRLLGPSLTLGCVWHCQGVSERFVEH